MSSGRTGCHAVCTPRHHNLPGHCTFALTAFPPSPSHARFLRVKSSEVPEGTQPGDGCTLMSMIQQSSSTARSCCIPCGKHSVCPAGVFDTYTYSDVGFEGDACPPSIVMQPPVATLQTWMDAQDHTHPVWEEQVRSCFCSCPYGCHCVTLSLLLLLRCNAVLIAAAAHAGNTAIAAAACADAVVLGGAAAPDASCSPATFHDHMNS